MDIFSGIVLEICFQKLAVDKIPSDSNFYKYYPDCQNYEDNLGNLSEKDAIGACLAAA